MSRVLHLEELPPKCLVRHPCDQEEAAVRVHGHAGQVSLLVEQVLSGSEGHGALAVLLAAHEQVEPLGGVGVPPSVDFLHQ